MSYAYALAERGRTLATRPLGKAIRTELSQSAADEDLVILDFSGVLSTSHSFADELVAKLAEEIDCGDVGFRLRLRGASPQVDRVVRKALERRSVAVPLAA